MRQYALTAAVLLLLMAIAWPAGAATSVVDSKHNLSVTGPGTIKSGASEICVFCHTPHSAAAVVDAPLWNKVIFSGTEPAYTVYSSDVLNQLVYPPAEQPVQGGKAVHIRKTRLCLSCHDGTIALGKLKNLPAGFSDDIPMSVSTYMQTTDAGYIGIDLRDDHPVSIEYRPDIDQELKTVPDGKEKTFLSAGVKYVECTSCHDPHDNQFGKFLVETNQYSALCIACHNKAGFSGSIHGTLTNNVNYSPPTGATPPNPTTLGDNVGQVKCMNCHFPHKTGVTAASPTTPNPGSGRYLLSFREEASCFNNPNRWGQGVTACHGSGASDLKRDIESQVSNGRPSKHPVADSTKAGRHEATEGRAGRDWTNAGTLWHVECQDCHNAHTAGPDRLPLGTNAVGNTSTLYGAGGARATSYPGWTPLALGTYVYIEPMGVLRTTGADLGVTKEYEICFKCHTDFAWDTTPPWLQSLGSAITNQAVEFNPSNPSYHPVVQANTNTQGTYLSPWNPASLVQTMYCSDCHGNNTAPPAGPHGSSNPFILKAAYTDTYGAKGADQPSTDLCFQCHSPSVYLTGADNLAGTGFSGSGLNLHTRHRTLATLSGISTFGYRCVNCHTRVPHGWKRPALVVVQNDGFPYEAIAGGGKIALPPTFSTNAYVRASCSTVNGCHQ